MNDSTGTGCYSLVGNNRFTSISLISGHGFARVTPSPQDYIQFHPGDVLGFYVEQAVGRGDGIVVHTDFTNDLVWYGSITQTNATFTLGSDGDLRTSMHAAPVISINTCKYTKLIL